MKKLEDAKRQQEQEAERKKAELDSREQKMKQEAARKESELDGRKQGLDRDAAALDAKEAAYRQKEATRQSIVQSEVARSLAAERAALEASRQQQEQEAAGRRRRLDTREAQLNQRDKQLTDRQAVLEGKEAEFQSRVNAAVTKRLAPEKAELSRQAQQAKSLIEQATSYCERHQAAVDGLRNEMRFLEAKAALWKGEMTRLPGGMTRWDLNRMEESVQKREDALRKPPPAPDLPAVPEMPDWLLAHLPSPSPSPSRGSSFRPR